jgi:hypothetical protein
MRASEADTDDRHAVKSSDGELVGESILADIVDFAVLRVPTRPSPVRTLLWLPRLVVREPDSHSNLGSYVTVLAVDSGWIAPGAGSSPAVSRTG